MIQLFHLCKKYGPYTALDDVNLNIEKGEFVFVTGPSGAGKTTLLRLLFGSEKPDQGYILINKINLTRISRSKMDLLRRKIGFVFQDFKLLPQRTVFDRYQPSHVLFYLPLSILIINFIPLLSPPFLCKALFYKS